MMLDGMAILNLPVPPLPLLPTRRTFKMFLTREVGGGETFFLVSVCGKFHHGNKERRQQNE